MTRPAEGPRLPPPAPGQSSPGITIHRAVGITSEQTALLGVATGGEVIEELF
jgi:hypothetical protein